MFEFLKRWRQTNQRLREVRADERRITALTAEHRYNLDMPFDLLGIPLLLDDTMEEGAVLYFTTAATPTVQLHPQATVWDRRLAQAMLLVHLAVTHAGKPPAQLPPYIIYASDLAAPEGPSHNEQWMEYMQAMELIIPVAAFKAIGALFPLNPAYALQRVLVVSYKTVQERARAISQNLGPILPKNFLPTKQCTAR